MIFRVSTTHIKRQSRKAIYVGLFFAVLIAGGIAMIVNSKSFSGMLLPAAGVLFFSQSIFGTYKHLKEGADAYPVVKLDEATGTMAVSHKDITVTVTLSQIDKLRLQYNSKTLESILLKTKSGEKLRFEGYENLVAMASVLERHVPKENIEIAKWYHR